MTGEDNTPAKAFQILREHIVVSVVVCQDIVEFVPALLFGLDNEPWVDVT